VRYLPAGLPVPVVPEGALGAPYFAAAREGRLVAQRCRGCGGWQWLPEWLCHRCHSFDLAYEPVEPEGVVHTWQRAWHPTHPALVGHGPYLVVVVELPQADGIRMVGNLLGDPMEPVEIGSPVRAEFEHHTDEDGHPAYTLVQWRRT
jgi:uncharacterized OB-fold protein